MKVCLALLAILLVAAHCQNWVVLVAGSDTFSNYRHQADVYHAYQSLLKKGMDKNKIIVMAVDDIAHSASNYHFPGKVFNKPTYKEPGVDVYAGIAIDYKGKSVTPTIFKDILLGNKTAVAGKGTGRVLESTANDNVFIFFCDHGAPGLIAFPNHYLYADDLLTILKAMKGRYNKLVFYLEACESGSMFTKLPTDQNIYALSAANPSESSWGTYCSPDDEVGGKHIGSCLGDLFSVNFVEDFDMTDITKETLEAQFDKVKKLTTKSQVMQWGDLRFTSNFVSDFIGTATSSLRSHEHPGSPSQSATMKPYYAKLNWLAFLYRQFPTQQNRKNLAAQMQSMKKFDTLFNNIRQLHNLQGKYDEYNINFQCLRESIETVEGYCGKLSEYSYQYIRYLALNCERAPASSILQVVRAVCAEEIS